MKKFYFLLALILISSLAIAQRAGEFGQTPDSKTFTQNALEVASPFNQPDFREILGHDSLNMRFVGNWGQGSSYNLLAAENEEILFLGAGAAVKIMDVSDLAYPVQLSVLNARALVDAIFYDAENHLLCLAAYFNGIEIWDVSDYENPQRVGQASTNGLPRGGIFKQGDYVFAVTVVDGVQVFDVSSLPIVSLVATGTIPGSQLSWNAAMWGNHIFVANGSGGCKVIDISDPLNPLYIKTIPGNCTGIDVLNGKAYVVSYQNTLTIHDVSDLQNIIQLGQTTCSGYLNKVKVIGDYAYVASQTTNPGGGMKVFDVSDPATPVELETLEDYARHICGNASFVATAGGGAGCDIFDIAVPAEPVLASQEKLPWDCWGLGVDGDFTYTGSNGFRIIDASNPSKPWQCGYDETNGQLAKISEDIAVFCPESAGGSNPVSFFDISDKTNPQLLGQKVCPAMTYSIDLVGTLAYIACWWDGVRVIDFSDPANPTFVAHLHGWVNGAIPGDEYCYAQAVEVQGDLCYILDYGPFPDDDTKGIYIFDVSDISNPVLINRFKDYQGEGDDFAVEGDFAYIADKLGGMAITSIADPMMPFNLGYCNLPDSPTGIEMQGQHAYISDYINGGVQVVDVSNPSSPFVSAFYKQSGCFAMQVALSGSLVYIADGPAGIGIYDHYVVTGIENKNSLQQASTLSCFPNPVDKHTNVTFTLENASEVQIELFDLSGRFVRVLAKRHCLSGENSISVNFSNESLMPGLYFIKLNTIDGAEWLKVIVK
jgi:hypothetical protein